MHEEGVVYMKKWVALILGTTVYFFVSILLNLLFDNSVHLIRVIIGAVIWTLLQIGLYALLKKIKLK